MSVLSTVGHLMCHENLAKYYEEAFFKAISGVDGLW